MLFVLVTLSALSQCLWNVALKRAHGSAAVAIIGHVLSAALCVPFAAFYFDEAAARRSLGGLNADDSTAASFSSSSPSSSSSSWSNLFGVQLLLAAANHALGLVLNARAYHAADFTHAVSADAIGVSDGDDTMIGSDSGAVDAESRDRDRAVDIELQSAIAASLNSESAATNANAAPISMPYLYAAQSTHDDTDAASLHRHASLISSTSTPPLDDGRAQVSLTVPIVSATALGLLAALVSNDGAVSSVLRLPLPAVISAAASAASASGQSPGGAAATDVTLGWACALLLVGAAIVLVLDATGALAQCRGALRACCCGCCGDDRFVHQWSPSNRHPPLPTLSQTASASLPPLAEATTTSRNVRPNPIELFSESDAVRDLALSSPVSSFSLFPNSFHAALGKHEAVSPAPSPSPSPLYGGNKGRSRSRENENRDGTFEFASASASAFAHHDDDVDRDVYEMRSMMRSGSGNESDTTTLRAATAAVSSVATAAASASASSHAFPPSPTHMPYAPTSSLFASSHSSSSSSGLEPTASFEPLPQSATSHSSLSSSSSSSPARLVAAPPFACSHFLLHRTTLALLAGLSALVTSLALIGASTSTVLYTSSSSAAIAPSPPPVTVAPHSIGSHARLLAANSSNFPSSSSSSSAPHSVVAAALDPFSAVVVTHLGAASLAAPWLLRSPASRIETFRMWRTHRTLICAAVAPAAALATLAWAFAIQYLDRRSSFDFLFPSRASSASSQSVRSVLEDPVGGAAHLAWSLLSAAGALALISIATSCIVAHSWLGESLFDAAGDQQRESHSSAAQSADFAAMHASGFGAFGCLIANLRLNARVLCVATAAMAAAVVWLLIR